MRVIETFVTSVPREKIPADAKWFMQDGDRSLKSCRGKICPKYTLPIWIRDPQYFPGSMLGKAPLSSDATETVVTREELMRAYDLVERGYTLWFGGKCPVEEGMLVDIICDDGEVILDIEVSRGVRRTSLVVLRGNASWELIDSPARIIAYRLSSTSSENEEEYGEKDDSQKTRFSLVPAEALSDVIDVLEFGAKKYGAENWRKVDNAQERYFNAAMRHLLAWRKGESSDDESGLPHLAHAATCLMFMIEGEKK